MRLYFRTLLHRMRSNRVPMKLLYRVTQVVLKILVIVLMVTTIRQLLPRTGFSGDPSGHEVNDQLETVKTVKGVLRNLARNNKKIDNPSKRSNLDVDVRPKTIFGPKEEYDDLAEFDTLEEIPLIFHQTYTDDSVPIVYKTWMQSWLKFHPNWQYWFWTDEDINKFITTRYPDFKDIFYDYKDNIQRSNVFRYFLMHEFGGFYMDLGMECLRTLDDLAIENNCLLTSEPVFHRLLTPSHKSHQHFVSKTFMACHPRSPFFKHVIGFLVDDRKNQLADPDRSTGTIMMEDAFTDYRLKKPLEEVPKLSESELFIPMVDKRKTGSIETFCKELTIGKWDHQSLDTLTGLQQCYKYLQDGANLITGNTYTVHHWANSWTDDDGKSIEGEQETVLFNIKDLLNDV